MGKAKHGRCKRGVRSAVQVKTLASVSIWTEVESARQPAQSDPVIETLLGADAPAAVLYRK